MIEMATTSITITAIGWKLLCCCLLFWALPVHISVIDDLERKALSFLRGGSRGYQSLPQMHQIFFLLVKYLFDRSQCLLLVRVRGVGAHCIAYRCLTRLVHFNFTAQLSWTALVWWIWPSNLPSTHPLCDWFCPLSFLRLCLLFQSIEHQRQHSSQPFVDERKGAALPWL